MPDSSDDKLTIQAVLTSSTAATGNTYFFGASLATDADSQVPEPVSMSLMAAGIVLLLAYRKHFRSGAK
jgi:hypothetical protein